MAIAFQGGPLDGQVEPMTDEDLTAEWVDGLKVYSVSDEEGNARGMIGSPTFGTPMVEEPKKRWRTQQFWSLAIFITSVLCWLVGGLVVDLSIKVGLQAFAYSLMVAAYLLKKWN